mmetsp:Transcript_6386/g.26843  ORF Transcript_6386/g.26843 Transcript_6386/m.26843 type:complete len:244 (+) Transcript_6386:170-901(+)
MLHADYSVTRSPKKKTPRPRRKSMWYVCAPTAAPSPAGRSRRTTTRTPPHVARNVAIRRRADEPLRTWCFLGPRHRSTPARVSAGCDTHPPSRLRCVEARARTRARSRRGRADIVLEARPARAGFVVRAVRRPGRDPHSWMLLLLLAAAAAAPSSLVGPPARVCRLEALEWSMISYSPEHTLRSSDTRHCTRHTAHGASKLPSSRGPLEGAKSSDKKTHPREHHRELGAPRRPDRWTTTTTTT